MVGIFGEQERAHDCICTSRFTTCTFWNHEDWKEVQPRSRTTNYISAANAVEWRRVLSLARARMEDDVQAACKNVEMISNKKCVCM